MSEYSCLDTCALVLGLRTRLEQDIEFAARQAKLALAREKARALLSEIQREREIDQLELLARSR